MRRFGQSLRVIVVVSICMISSTLFATEYTVNPGESIQATIDIAIDGDTIIVAEGTYVENIDVNDLNITLTSSDPNDPNVVAATIIDANSIGRCITITDSNSIIAGFTITNGLGDNGGGIYCLFSDLVITDCVIENNKARDGLSMGEAGKDGGGFYADVSNVLMNNCSITNNSAGNGFGYLGTCAYGASGGNGGGIYLSGTEIIINNTRIELNVAGAGCFAGPNIDDGGFGGGICSFNSIIDIFGCIVKANRSGYGSLGCGGGLSIEESEIQISESHIANNYTPYTDADSQRTGHGGGVHLVNCQYAHIIKSLIEYNYTSNGTDDSVYAGMVGNGGGIYCYNTPLVIINSSLIKNSTGDGGEGKTAYSWPGGDGGGIWSHDVTIRNSVIMGNTTGNGGSNRGEYDGRNGGNGAGFCCDTATIINSIIMGNITGDGGDGGEEYYGGDGSIGGNGGDGGGLYGSHVKIDKSVVYGNSCGIGGEGYIINGRDGLGGGVYGSAATQIENSIIWDNTFDQIYGYDCNNISFCDIEDGACVGINGNIAIDPLFTDSNNGDFHLQSEYGRWDPNQSMWVYDAVTSPCIDAGDTADPNWMNELWPHGKRINMGAYGGTPEASMSSSMVGNIADFNHDDCVGLEDFVMFIEEWLTSEVLCPEDIDLDGQIDLADYSIFSENWNFCIGHDLAGWWQFDETAGTQADDSSTYGNDGTLMNGPVWTGSGELSFDGINDYVEVLDSNSLSFTNQITISTWIQLAVDDDRFMKIVVQPSSVDSVDPWENYCIDLRNKNPRFTLSSGVPGTWNGCFDTSYSSPLDVGVWYHLAGTYDGSTMTLYVNGQPTQTHQVALTLGDNALPVYIGGRPEEAHFNGLIDEVRIYNRALTETEIQNLFQSH